MGQKSYVIGCCAGYKPGDAIPMFRFPNDVHEKETWLKSIPRDNISDS